MKISERVAVVNGAAHGSGRASAAGSASDVIALPPSVGLARIKRGIDMPAIASGIIDNPMYDAIVALCAESTNMPIGENRRRNAAGVPNVRMGKPEDLASLATLPASGNADPIADPT